MAVEDGKKLDLAYIELSATKAGYPLYKELGFVEEVPHYTSMKYHIQA